LGFDFGDPLWDDHRVRMEFQTRHASFPLSIHWVRLYGSGPQITLAYNTIARQAFADGCEYSVLTNDDLIFQTTNWTSKAVEQLLRFHIPNFGIVSFLDPTGPGGAYPTFHMTHRTHMQVFDAYSPVFCPIMHSISHCDPSLFDMYAPFGLAIFRLDLRVRNFAGGNHKTRYASSDEPNTALVVARGRQRIADVLAQRNQLRSWMPSTEHAFQQFPRALWTVYFYRANSTVESPLVTLRT